MDCFTGSGSVVTGGASGIGYAVARRLGQRGARVVIADVDLPSLAKAVHTLGEEGIEVHAQECDVRSVDDVAALADFAFDRLGHVDVLFNNAGVGTSGPILSTSMDDWKWILEVDLWGSIHGVHAFLPRMIAQGSPAHVLFTASHAGLAPVPGMGAYSVAKFGVVALAEVLRSELRQHQIGVSVVCPMRVNTNFGNSGRKDGGARTANEANTDLVSKVPSLAKGSKGLGRVLTPDEVAEATIAAIERNSLYALPHPEGQEFIKRRFDRIDRSFPTAYRS